MTFQTCENAKFSPTPNLRKFPEDVFHQNEGQRIQARVFQDPGNKTAKILRR